MCIRDRLLIAINPALIAGDEWQDRSEAFMQKLLALDGIRIPGQRRHRNRLDQGMRSVNAELVAKIRGFC